MIVAIVVMVILILLLLFRLVYLQISNQQYYSTLSEKNRVSIQPIPPTRGLIYDRNGVLLAQNLPSFTLELVPEKIKDLDNTLKLLTELITITEDDLEEVFRTYETIIRDERDRGNRIAIDITPGRKYMSAFSLYAGLKDGTIDKIYYIHIRGKKYMNHPYPMIPVPYCDLEDIVSIGGVHE